MHTIDALYESELKLDGLEMFLIHVSVKREFSFGVWNSRQHIFLKVRSGSQVGYGEEIISLNDPDVSLADWGGKLKQLEHLPLGAMWGQMQGWPHRLREMTEMALIDLYGKVNGASALSILGLQRREAVPGLYCILEQNPASVYEKAKKAAEQGMQSHIKVKLFGSIETDIPVITAAKDAVPHAFLVGDVNMGYRKAYEQGSAADVAETLQYLHRAGLDACEDPAEMDRSQWIDLQKQVQPLQLIPDAPMRPAAASLRTVVPEMGGIFNIHPGSMGSLLDAVQLIRKIQSFNGGIMIGDNSLIGPACTVWQQIAIGSGALFVEALEKKEEMPQYLDMVRRSATAMDEHGRTHLAAELPGFGLELDEKQLKQHCKAHETLF